MKVSVETLSVLKNFASINSGLEFKTGNKLATISPGKTVLAKATLPDSFPEDFCVYDLPQFLSVYSLYKDADLMFDSSNIIFKSGKSKTNYRKTAKEMIITVPDKPLSLPSVDVSFVLTEDVFSAIMKAASVLQSPNIGVESDGDNVYVTAFNAKDDSAHTNSIEVGEGNGQNYKMVFLTENLKMIMGTYNVEISFKGLACFKNANQEIEYWVATEAKDSKIGD